MRYKLKDYQEAAATALLERLADSSEDHRNRGRRTSFALSATTGAGKTVIASAVIEALFEGSAELAAQPDPSAVALWVTDDPSLNEQTRARVIASADRLELSQLVTIDETFDQAEFEPRNLYFLNVQKLSATSGWVKHSDERTYTLWETIANTIASLEKTLYVIVDEAHRGMRSRVSKAGPEERRSTIIQRLVNGHNGIPAVPVVWGISATIERFDAAMREAQIEGRFGYPPVDIDAAVVQESGLLKDSIVLSFPDEEGEFDTALLRSAVASARDFSAHWSEYMQNEGAATEVAPLLVIQVGNKPSTRELMRFANAIYEEWPELPGDAMANVFGEHEDLDLGEHIVSYIAPQDVQDASQIRVLFAKDAVSTGWDCPRAEVLFSVRSAKDRTYITQILGRMVRSPLARRVAADDRLNSVECFLPRFDRKTAIAVAKQLTGEAGVEDEQIEKGVPGRRVLIAPVELRLNKELPEEVATFFGELPSEQKPAIAAKPVRRLFDLATALSWDGLLEGANAAALAQLYALLDGKLAQHSAAIDTGVKELLTAEIRRITVRMDDDSQSEAVGSRSADEETVADAYGLAVHSFGAKVAHGYVKHLAARNGESKEDPDIEGARARVAVLAGIDGIRAAVEEDAESLAKSWLAQFYVGIKHLPEERQALYGGIRSQARDPERQDPVLPEVVIAESEARDGTPYPTKKNHLISGAGGDFPLGALNETERQVLDFELSRPNVLAWYRNPAQPIPQAIRIPYRVGEGWKSMQPDFIFISRRSNETLAASIVDPHSAHLSDSLLKLLGLADFAETYDAHYMRIDSIDKGKDGEHVVLNLKDEEVRTAIRSASSAADLFTGPHAIPYQ